MRRVTVTAVRPLPPVVSLDLYKMEPARLLGLVRRTAEHDRRAFTRLYDALAPMVRTAVDDIVADRVRADAVTSAAFVEAWQSAQQHTARGTDVAAWIHGLAVRRAEAPPAADETLPGAAPGRSTLAQLLQRTRPRR